MILTVGFDRVACNARTIYVWYMHEGKVNANVWDKST